MSKLNCLKKCITDHHVGQNCIRQILTLFYVWSNLLDIFSNLFSFCPICLTNPRLIRQIKIRIWLCIKWNPILSNQIWFVPNRRFQRLPFFWSPACTVYTMERVYSALLASRKGKMPKKARKDEIVYTLPFHQASNLQRSHCPWVQELQYGTTRGLFHGAVLLHDGIRLLLYLILPN